MKKFRNVLFGIFACLLTIGCSNDENTGGPTGQMVLRLTDAPFPYELVSEANVTIFKIDARHKTEAEGDGEMGESESPFVVLMEDEVEVNLLELTNGITETLVNGEFPVGEYDLVRVYVKGINVKLTDGTTYDLDIPSGAQSGIKVFLTPPITVTSTLTADLLLDFDVSKSFVPLGSTESIDGITGFNFTPVIKGSNMSTAGTLNGNVSTVIEGVDTPLQGAQVTLYSDGLPYTSTFTDETGAYKIMGIDAGAYDVGVELDGYESQEVEGIQIVAANETTQDFELVASGE